MTHRVVVPMKPLTSSKTRLRDVLSDAQRELLSRAMLVRVLRAAMGSDAVDEVIVVGADNEIAQIAGVEGASWRAQPGRDLNDTLRVLFAETVGSVRPIESVTYLPADLPLVTADDVTALVLGSSDGCSIVVAPDRSAQGTNGLTVPSGIAFVTLLGESSFTKHLAAIEGAGLVSRLCEREGLAFDVDVPADLDDLLRMEPSWWEIALSLAGADAGVGA